MDYVFEAARIIDMIKKRREIAICDADLSDFQVLLDCFRKEGSPLRRKISIPAVTELKYTAKKLSDFRRLRTLSRQNLNDDRVHLSRKSIVLDEVDSVLEQAVHQLQNALIHSSDRPARSRK